MVTPEGRQGTGVERRGGRRVVARSVRWRAGTKVPTLSKLWLKAWDKSIERMRSASAVKNLTLVGYAGIP
jgi:hypothetical protein